MKVLVLVVGLFAVMAASQAHAQSRWHGQTPRFEAEACEPWYCAESDWIADNSHGDHTTVWRHRMRATPRTVSILFTPDPKLGPVYPLVWPWQWQTTGNPQGLEVDNRAVRLHIWSGAPMHGVWRPGKGWTTWRRGYWKIIVYR